MGCNDIRDIRHIENAVKETDCDRILHLAAIARFSDADADIKRAYETNVEGTRNVAKIAGKYHVPIVYASTGSVYMPINYDPPITEDFPVKGNSVYGCSKAVGEQYIKSYNNTYIILRYAHLYGKEKRGHGLVGGFIERIERGLAPTLYGGKQSNDFLYIKDVARANRLACEAPWDKWNQSYNIGTGQELSAEDAGRAVCKATGYTGEIKTVKQREVDASRFVYDTTKAEQLGFKAEYNFAEGLKNMFSGQESKK